MSTDAILSELKASADPEKAEHSKRFFKSGKGEYAEGDHFLGLTVPQIRKIAKSNKNLSLDEVEPLIKNKYHEVRLAALLLLVYKIEKADQETIDEVAHFYLKNLEYVNNWDLVDSSCRFILARHLEFKDRSLLYKLAGSESIWERRIAIITCYYFIKQKDYNDALAIADLLLHDKHDLIHKAVGWMLREIGNMDLEVEEGFLLENNRYRKMPRTMLRYAIEKFEEKRRKAFLNGSL